MTAGDDEGGGEARPVRRGLLVAGMHRSGTSALTRVLSLLGAALPKTLLAPDARSNPTGFWEPVELIALSERLLDAFDQTWMSLNALPNGWRGSGAAIAFERDLGSLVDRDLPEAGLFALKDPRLCRILAAAGSALRLRAIEPLVVICLRDPVEVALSLHRRQEFPPSKGQVLWLRHMLDVERASRGMRRTVVLYEDLLTDWRAVAERIGVDLGLDWPVDLDTAASSVSAFLDPELRHHRALSPRDIPHPWLRDAYTALQALRASPRDAVAEAALDRVGGELASQDTLLLDAMFYEGRWAMTERIGRLAAEAANSEAQALESALRAEADQARSQASAADAALQEARGARTALQDEVADMSAHLAALHAAAEEARSQASAADAALQEARGARTALQDEVADMSAQRAALHAAAEEARSQAAESDRALQESRRALAAAEEAREALRGEVGGLSARAAGVESALAAAHAADEARRSAMRVALEDRRRVLAATHRRRLDPVRIAGRRRPRPAALDAAGLFDPGAYARALTALGVPAPHNLFDHYLRHFFDWIDPGPLFDMAFYLKTYPDVAAAGVSPLLHYLERGWREGRDPNPAFSAAFYLRRRPDVAVWSSRGGAGPDRSPLAHYLKHGDREGQDPSPYFDVAYYRAQAGSEIAPAQTALSHFREAGVARRLSPNPLFDVTYYLERHPEVLELGLDPLSHYRENAGRPGVKPHPYFDPAFYLSRYGDVRSAGVEPLAHFLEDGWREGRQPNEFFDPLFYRERNEDVARSGADPLRHYLEYGASERRSPHSAFDPRHYLDAYSDLVVSGCDPLGHYLDHGRREGRRPNAAADPVNDAAGHVALVSSAPAPASAPATYRALPWRGRTPRNGVGLYRILICVHTAGRTGAPLCALEVARRLAAREDLDCRVLLFEGGPLEREFEAAAPTLRLDLLPGGRDAATEWVARLYREDSGRCVAIVNTVVLVDCAEVFARCRVPVLAWVHELPTSIELLLGGGAVFRKLAGAARKIMCPSDFVRNALISHYALDPGLVRTLRNGTALPPADLDYAAARAVLGVEFALPEDALVVLGCGTVDMRKGVDLFVRLAPALKACDPALARRIWLLWIGDPYDARFRGWIEHDAERLGVADRVLLAGVRSDVSRYFAGADIFALTSREDPFPMVNMEALAHGLPVIAFEGAGGAAEVLGDGRGATVPYADVEAMAAAVVARLTARPQDRGAAAAAFAAERQDWDSFIERLLALLDEGFDRLPPRPCPQRVSVVIPNYNHAEYLPQRFESVFAQTRLPDEIIFIDDHSTDGSVEIARRYAARSPVPFQVHVNERNNGSTFRQWLRGIELSSGDLVWIAESDDWCEPEFLERLAPEFDDSAVRLAFAQSRIVGPKGEIYAPDYLDYTDALSTTRWRSWRSSPAEEEIEVALSQKNTIPNASAVVFRRIDPEKVRGRLEAMLLCGDWWFYQHVIRGGRISFFSQPLNSHRRHSKTVTHAIERDDRAAVESLAVKTEILASYPVSGDMRRRSLAASIYEHDRLTRVRGETSAQTLADSPDLRAAYEALRVAVDPAAGEQRLRILTVLPDVQVGGGQIAAIRLANALAERCDSYLVNARPASVDPGVASLIGPEIRLLEGTLGMTEWAAEPWRADNPNQLAEGPARLRVVRELLRAHRIDVILSHVWWADRFVHAAAAGLGVPWFIRMHGCYEGLMDQPDWDPAFADLVRPMLRSVDGVVYSTERNLAVFSRLDLPHPPTIQRLFNGFDPAEAPTASTAGPLRREPGDFVFCLCSRAIPEKGWEEAIAAVLAINALPSARRGGRKARLALVGGGLYADGLAARYAGQEAIVFCGQMTRVVEVVAQCDVGLLPSRFVSESLPSTIIEYLACGVPAVTTDNGSIAEMVTADGRDAALVMPLGGALRIDPVRLVDLMLRYMTEPTLLASHRANARYVFDRLFDIRRVAGDYLEAMEPALRLRRDKH